MPMFFRRRYLEGISDKVMAEEVLERLEQMRYPEGMLDVEIERLEEIATVERCVKENL